MAKDRQSEVKSVRKRTGKAPSRDPSMKGGARGGDPAASPDPNENKEPPIVQRTA